MERRQRGPAADLEQSGLAFARVGARDLAVSEAHVFRHRDPVRGARSGALAGHDRRDLDDGWRGIPDRVVLGEAIQSPLRCRPRHAGRIVFDRHRVADDRLRDAWCMGRATPGCRDLCT